MFIINFYHINKFLEMGTTDKPKVYIENKDLLWVQLDVGIKRKNMVWDENLMLVKDVNENGGLGTLLHHYHISYVESGVFQPKIEGVKKVLSAGDAFNFPYNVVHGTVCLEAGVLNDVHSPCGKTLLSNSIIFLV